MKEEIKWLLECDSDSAECQYDDFKESFINFFDLVFKQAKERKLLLSIEAKNSNWRGQTGYAYANSSKELLSKILDGSHFESTKIGYHPAKNVAILSSGHDVTGSSITLTAIKDKEKPSSNDMFPIVYDFRFKRFKILRFSLKTFVNHVKEKIEKGMK